MAAPLPDAAAERTPPAARPPRRDHRAGPNGNGRAARPVTVGSPGQAGYNGHAAHDERDAGRDIGPDAVTVAEALRVVLSGSRIAGGAAGLSRRVTWATSLRSRPPAFELRGGGEFVLAARETLAGLHQADHSLTLPRILEGLSQAGAAALACTGPLAAEAAAAADALALPLVEVPAGAALVDAERGIIALVLDRHNELQARASQFYRQLAQLSVEAQGLDAILQEAANVTGLVVAFEDHLFRLRAVAAPRERSAPPAGDAVLSSVEERGRLAEAVRAQPLSSTTPPAIVLSAARWRMERAAAPVVTRERLRGYVSLCGTQGIAEFDQLAASRLAAVCALELASDDRVLAAEQRVQGDLVDELLRPYGDAEAAARHAAQAGFTRDGSYAVFVFEAEPDPGRDAATGLADALSRQFRRTPYPALVKRDAGTAIAICQLAGGDGPEVPERSAPRVTNERAAAAPQPDEEAPSAAPALDGLLRAAGRQVFDAAATAAGEAHVTGGASRVHDGLAALPAAMREARDALRIGRRVYGPGRLISYADLGLYRVLHSLHDTPELASFFEQTLGPLVEYDRRTGQNLIETLEAFFACHGNLSETAQRLGYHRNSLMYRIRRIQEIGGVDLEDPETRLSLQVALKAKRLLS